MTLDDPAVVDFLRRNHRVFLFCRDEKKRPIGYAMHSVGFRDGRLYFATYTKSAKVRHLENNPEVACLVLGGEPGPWLSLHGTADVRSPTADEVDAMIGTQSPDARVPASVVASVRDRLLSGKRTFIRVAFDEVHDARLGDDHVR